MNPLRIQGPLLVDARGHVFFATSTSDSLRFRSSVLATDQRADVPALQWLLRSLICCILLYSVVNNRL